MTTIKKKVVGPFTMKASDNPLTITSSGSVVATRANADGIDAGTNTVAWSISNAGTVSSASGNGIVLKSAGNIGNSGSISGKDGVILNAGGRVTNAAGGQINGTGAAQSGVNSGVGVSVAGAAGTVANNGSIRGVVYGVGFAKGGAVTNSGTITGGEDGVFIQGGKGTIVNSGSITATVDDGVALFAGGSVTNNAGATISDLAAPKGAAVFFTNAAATLTNAGKITGHDFGAFILAGGKVSNLAGGSISGKTAGVFANNVAVTVNNAGTVTGVVAGLDIEAGGTITNAATGTISAQNYGVFVTGAAGSLDNAGKITASISSAVAFARGGSVTNEVRGIITGQSSGVDFDAGPGVLHNSGTIAAVGAGGAGAYLNAGGNVANFLGGVISGAAFGVFANNVTATVDNKGTISGLHGVGLAAGGILTNYATGVITGQTAGVTSNIAAATVYNHGSIKATAAGGAGIDIEGGGSVTNYAGASITGTSFGVFEAGGGTLHNAGTIGGGAYAVLFAGTTNDTVIVDPGAVFNGLVDAGGGTNTLELTTGAGSISGINNGAYANFQVLLADTGSNWTASGANSVATVLDNGVLNIQGKFDVTGTIDAASKGRFALGANAVLEVAATASHDSVIDFLGKNGQLLVDNFSAFGTGVGTTGYRGPTIADFASGDSIDLANLTFGSSMTIGFTQSTGTLSISNGTQTADVALLGTFMASSFATSSDGHGGTLITVPTTVTAALPTLLATAA